MPFIAAEFFYALPADPARRSIVLANFHARLAALHPGDQVLLLTGDAALTDALLPTLAAFPALTHTVQWVTPRRSADGLTFVQTDRWARLAAAFDYAAHHANADTALLLPALDAVYDRRLLARLLAIGGPASAWTPCHHAGMMAHHAGDGPIAAAMNAAFNRDRGFKRRLRRGETQQFWGKLGLIPTRIAGALAAATGDDHLIWEDDMAIDRALTALGHPARTLWISDPALYRLHPPILTEADLFRAIERHLHYAIHGGSGLLLPPDRAQRRRMQRDPAYAAAVTLADRLIAEAQAALEAALAAHGASRVIWGGYRITARRGDPFVTVEAAPSG